MSRAIKAAVATLVLAGVASNGFAADFMGLYTGTSRLERPAASATVDRGTVANGFSDLYISHPDSPGKSASVDADGRGWNKVPALTAFGIRLDADKS